MKKNILILLTVMIFGALIVRSFRSDKMIEVNDDGRKNAMTEGQKQDYQRSVQKVIDELSQATVQTLTLERVKEAKKYLFSAIVPFESKERHLALVFLVSKIENAALSRDMTRLSELLDELKVFDQKNTS